MTDVDVRLGDLVHLLVVLSVDQQRSVVASPTGEAAS